jgi:hypothetical protein
MKMKNQSKIAALLAAGFVLGTGGVSLAQTSTGGKVVRPPSTTTGSGKDTGMNVESGMSGNGPGGVGVAGHGTSPTKKSSSSGKKKNAKHSKKKSHSSKNSNGSAAMTR